MRRLAYSSKAVGEGEPNPNAGEAQAGLKTALNWPYIEPKQLSRSDPDARRAAQRADMLTRKSSHRTLDRKR